MPNNERPESLTMSEHKPNSFRNGPDEQGMFGIFGGRFVAETLMPNILELNEAWTKAKQDPEFQQELTDLNTHYTGRPSPPRPFVRTQLKALVMTDELDQAQLKLSTSAPRQLPDVSAV